MSIIPISRLDDPRLAVYRSLKATNQTRGLDQFVVEGPKLVERLRDSRFPIVSVLAEDHRADALASLVSPDVPLYAAPSALFRELIGFAFHQGVLACGRRSPWPWPGPGSFANGRLTLVACPDVQSPENLGSIFRLADVFGVDGVLLGPSCPDPFSRRVLRVSMGFALHRPAWVVPDLLGHCARLRAEEGFALLAAVATEGAEPFDERPRPERLVLVLGNEANGLGSDWLEASDRRLTIPMRPGAESLNVALAAGILLHHFSRDPGGPGR